LKHGEVNAKVRGYGEREAQAYNGVLGAKHSILQVYKVDKMMTLQGRVSAVCDQRGM